MEMRWCDSSLSATSAVASAHFPARRLRHHFQDGLFQVRFDTLLPIPPKRLIHSFLFRSTAPLCSALLVTTVENEQMDLGTTPRKVQTLLTKK